jgi:hypothetical protein
MRQIFLHMRRASLLIYYLFIICRDQNANRRNINQQAGYIYLSFAILATYNEGLDTEIIGKSASSE